MRPTRARPPARRAPPRRGRAASIRSAIVSRSKRASSSSAVSGACGCGSASRTPSTKRSQPRRAIASRSSIVPVRRSSPTCQWARPASSLTVTESPALVSSEKVCGWCQCTQAPPYSIWKPVPVGAPGATPEPVAGLEQQRPAASQSALAGGGDAREASPDDDHVIALGHRRGVQMYVHGCTRRRHERSGQQQAAEPAPARDPRGHAARDRRERRQRRHPPRGRAGGGRRAGLDDVLLRLQGRARRGGPRADDRPLDRGRAPLHRLLGPDRRRAS